jgi:RNA polymerase sigma-70 factor (ECF subfamily)
LELFTDQISGLDMSDPGKIFATLLVSNDQHLRRYIGLFLHRRDDVEEVLQQTAAALWEKFPEYDTNRDFLPWATRFAYFEILNFRRDKARERVFFTEDVMEFIAEAHAEVSEELRNRRERLQECLSNLGPEDLRLLQRRYSDNATIKDLSDETGRTVKSLYRRLDRIRELVAACVDRNSNAPEFL